MVEVANLRIFVVMVKGDVELKIFHSMLKYNIFLYDCFHGGPSIGREAVDIQDTTGQAMSVAGN